MSFRELTAWVSGLIILGFYGNFVLHAGEHTDVEATARALVGIVIAIIIVEVIVNVILATLYRQPDQRADERDRSIYARSYRNAYYILAGGIFFALVYSLVPRLASFVESFGFPDTTAMSHVLVIALVLGELVIYGSRIIYYRLGA